MRSTLSIVNMFLIAVLMVAAVSVHAQGAYVSEINPLALLP